MTKPVQVSVEHISFFTFQIAKCEFLKPVTDRFRPIAQIRTACSGYEANLYGLFDGQSILSIVPCTDVQGSAIRPQARDSSQQRKP